MKTSLMLLIAILLSPPVLAKDVDGDGLETTLIPIVFAPERELAGAFGSIWAGEIWIANQSDEGLLLQAWDCIPVCHDAAEPNSITTHKNPLVAGADRGLLYVILDEIAEQVHYTARMFELSRHSQPNGIDVPVVREHEFLRGVGMMLGVPINSDSRATLRIYGPTRAPDHAVNIEVLSENGDLLEALTLEVLPGAETFWPGYAQIPNLRDALELPEGRVHIRLESVSGIPYWPLVSVTDNHTQHVLLVPPAQ